MQPVTLHAGANISPPTLLLDRIPHARHMLITITPMMRNGTLCIVVGLFSGIGGFLSSRA